jgi:hypothetical protein
MNHRVNHILAAALAILTTAAGPAAGFASPSSAKRLAPGMFRLEIPFETAWSAMLDLLREEGWNIEKEDHTAGEILTAYKEYISGSMTETQLAKVAEVRPLGDGDWIRADLRYDIQIQLVEPRVTLVTIQAGFRALSRSFLGEQKWHSLPSLGKKEAELLFRLGRRLFGDRFELEGSAWDWLQIEPPAVPPEGRTNQPRTTSPQKP